MVGEHVELPVPVKRRVRRKGFLRTGEHSHEGVFHVKQRGVRWFCGLEMVWPQGLRRLVTIVERMNLGASVFHVKHPDGSAGGLFARRARCPGLLEANVSREATNICSLLASTFHVKPSAL